MEKYFTPLESETLHTRGLEKVADTRRKEFTDIIRSFIEKLRPDKDKHIFTLTIAMGSSEFWGPNSNGDYWPKMDLSIDNPLYGHKSFMNAGLYQDHKNKDKGKTLGQVVLALYNPIMERVELIERVDRDKCKVHDTNRIYDRLLDGETIGRSMGSHIDFDVCYICQNKAKTRAEYCNHAKYMMNQILGDGRKVCVINPKPRFFDISFVGKPADPTARVLSTLKENSTTICMGNICVIKKEVEPEKPKEETKKAPPKEELEKAAFVKTSAHHINYKGLKINIEKEKGEIRHKKNWETKMHCSYGSIPKTEGEDGDALDVYVKLPETDKVFIIKQQKNGKFDEDKIMLGFNSKEEARNMYLKHMPEGFYGGVVETTFPRFIERYLPKFKKEAEELLHSLCSCGQNCCNEKSAANKNVDKRADMIKQVPVLTQELEAALKNYKKKASQTLTHKVI
jgi:hypothetical protein